MKQHYHVMSGLSGCMPDTNEVFTSRKEAEKFAVSWANDCRNDCGLVLTGSARNGYYYGNGVSGIDYISIDTCTDIECLEGNE